MTVLYRNLSFWIQKSVVQAYDNRFKPVNNLIQKEGK